MSAIAVVGLATMGMNLARNLARNGFGVSVYNRTTSRVDDFMKQFGAEGAFTPARSPQELVAQLDRPRRILMMVKAGPPVRSEERDRRRWAGHHGHEPGPQSRPKWVWRVGL